MYFLYNEDRAFARREGKPRGYINYRDVLCQIGLKMILKGKKDGFSKLLKGLKCSLDNEKDFFLDNYLEFYFIENHNIYILIDKTNGIFPLVFYNTPKTTVSNKIDALSKALEDLQDNEKSITELLNKNDEWNKNLKDNLEKIYTYKSDEENND